MADPAKRVAKYTAKVTPERSSDTVAARLGTMTPNFTGVANDIVQSEQQVRTVLNVSGVPTIQYPYYLSFGRELWARVRRGMAGESLAMEAAILIAKWVGQGLTQAVLQAIRTDVFNVAAPIAP